VSGGATWTAATHVLENDLTVESGVLEIEACSVIRMPDDGSITVANGGALRLIGTEDCPITITFSAIAPQRGDWSSIEFIASADNGNNQFDYVVVECGGGLGYGALWFDTGSGLTMTNTIVRDSANFGMQLSEDVSLPGFSDNTLTANALGPIALYANDVGQLGSGTCDQNDVDAIHVYGGEVATDQTWAALGVPYVIETTVGVTADTGSAHLTLAAGTTLAFDEEAGPAVGNLGGLTAVGTTTDPITFTSAKATPAAGDWTEIDIYAVSNGPQNVFTFTDISYGGGDNYGQVWLDDGAALQVDNVAFANGAASTCDVYLSAAGSSLTVAGGTAPVTCGP